LMNKMLKSSEDFKEKIRFILLRITSDYNISQEKLAYKIDVDPRTVRKWIAGDSTPTITNMCVLAREFNLSLDELFEISD